jgi:hypothetical protein
LATREVKNSADLLVCISRRYSKVSPKRGSPKLPGGRGDFLLEFFASDLLNKAAYHHPQTDASPSAIPIAKPTLLDTCIKAVANIFLLLLLL